jgi:hypothetical protein
LKPPSNPIHCKSILAITWPIDANKGNSSQIKTYLLNENLREIKRWRICNSFHHTTQPIYFLTASLTENLLNLLTNWLFLSFRVSWVFSSWVHLDIQEENNNQQSRPWNEKATCCVSVKEECVWTAKSVHLQFYHVDGRRFQIWQ